jgi:P-type E1-E2 ATPase
MEIKPWQSIKVGNIIKVDENEFFPADIVPFHSSDQKGTCYVETKGLDGETNLKLKQVEKRLNNMYHCDKIDEMTG